MIYLFHGSDTDRVRTKAFAWVAKAREKDPGVVYIRLSKEELTASSLEDVASAGGLFSKRLLVLIDDPYPARKTASESEEGDATEGDVGIIDAHIDALAASDNAIVLLAPDLSAPRVKKILPKVKIEYRVDGAVGAVLKRGFNTGLVNALAARSREKLWLEVVRSLRAGDAPEMLHGLLHWKARDLLEKGSRAWSKSDSRALSRDLILLLRDSRSGVGTLGDLLEKFSLSI